MDERIAATTARPPVLLRGWQAHGPLAGSMRALARRLPRAWVLACSAAAWLGLVAAAGPLGGGASFDEICRSLPVAGDWRVGLRALAWAMLGWLAMAVAMMLPLHAEPLAHVEMSTPWDLRGRAVGAFVVGFLGPWLGVGLAAHLAMFALAGLLPRNASFSAVGLPSFAFAVAAVWVWTPAMRSARIACARTRPIRIDAWGAPADAVRYGAMMGSACVRTCWAPMVALMLSGHAIALTMLVAALLAFERYCLPHRSRALGLAWAALAVLGPWLPAGR